MRAPVAVNAATSPAAGPAFPAAGAPHRLRRLPVIWLGVGLLFVGGATAAFFAGRHVKEGEVTPPVEVVQPASPQTAAPPASRRDTVAAAAVCSQCGVVESVQAVQRKGDGSGVGAVAGGVLGGALGSQVGRGDGRTAMTVLGAIGGGFAGNEVEKRARAVTVYRVKVRTDGGEVRTVEQRSAPAVGQRVRFEGRQLQVIDP